jgi:hypothetical protein
MQLWDPSLKLTGLIADEMEDEDEDDSRTQSPRSAQIALPVFIPSNYSMDIAAATFATPVPILPPSTP